VTGHPDLYLVRQRFESHRLADVGAAGRDALGALGERLPRRGSVAVLVGSRGITALPEIVGAVVEVLRGAGAAPFVVPAMGSHGGATAEGQRACLASLGITPASVGAEIRATMDATRVATSPGDVPSWVDAAALGADAIVPVNRVKPHTIFGGAFQSGLAKMLLIGLGNGEGARAIHAAAIDRPFDVVAREALPVLLAAVHVPFGVAIVEDAHHDVAVVEAVPGSRILEREPALLRSAIAWMPSLPVDDVDLLVVDEIAKHISGQGADPNVTGRKAGATSGVRVARLFVRELAPGAGGNAHGIGQADATTRRLVDAADWPLTWVNTVASGNFASGRIPPYFDSDRAAIDALLGTIGTRSPADARVVRIHDTLALETVEVSAGCLGAFARPASTEVARGPYAMAFDAAGNLPPLGE
jgi:hypothetical protein